MRMLPVYVLLTACTGNPPGMRTVVWPDFGPERDALVLSGHTNALPDFIGPIDGSARLTVMTEGNHFPVLLPLVFDEFPVWCRENGCDVKADQILVVTLPQYMVVQALTSGAIRVGNAVVPIENEPGRVFPDVVMGGQKPLSALAARGVIAETARVFARHRGLGLLVAKPRASRIRNLEALARDDAPVVLATPAEAGARNQYVDTLDALLGARRRQAILAREVTFDGRLRIQHRDVPFAVLSGVADVGILFGHLASFYADAFPDRLLAVTVEGASSFGREIAVAQSTKRSPVGATFERFLMERAPAAYPNGGFAELPETEFARELVLGP